MTEKALVLDPEFAERVCVAVRDGAEQAAFDAEDEGVELGNGLVRTETFEEAMLLTRDRGFVMYFSDGSEARVTVQAMTPRRGNDLRSSSVILGGRAGSPQRRRDFG